MAVRPVWLPRVGYLRSAALAGEALGADPRAAAVYRVCGLLLRPPLLLLPPLLRLCLRPLVWLRRASPLLLLSVWRCGAPPRALPRCVWGLLRRAL